MADDAGAWDVFVSYCHDDGDWVRVLAENLHQSGLRVFFDKWEIRAGDVLVQRLEAGLRDSRAGILVVSPAALARRWVRAEYAVLVTRAIEHDVPLVPVLLRDAELPPFLATRVWIDFRSADGPDYLARVAELARVLKGERRGPPARTGAPALPPGSGFLAAGPRPCQLAIAPERTGFSQAGGGAIVAAPSGSVAALAELAGRFASQRAGLGPAREAGGVAAANAGQDALLHEMGLALAAAFLPPAVAAALTAAIEEAVRLGSPLELALELAEPLAELPWETLCLPGLGPLALHPRVSLFRRTATGGPAPALAVPGPLRILVAIGSPEVQNTGNDLLDMETELGRILDATDAPRQQGRAWVRILENGSVTDIHQALSERRYHILHLSCHALPGALILETADGAEDRVSGEAFWRQAIPAGSAPPLVVLAGCATGRGCDPDPGPSEAGRLPGLARTLVAAGVPAVIAMQDSVGDRYATDLMAEVYHTLATAAEPQPLAALNHARRVVEAARRQQPPEHRAPPEWATPTLFTAATPLRLYDPAGGFETLREPDEPRFDPGVVVRRINDMVGRRREQRLIRRTLRDRESSGVLIHGLGGVGKSTLTARILHQLADSDGVLVVSVAGETNPDRLLGVVADRLETAGLRAEPEDRGYLGRIAALLREVKLEWRRRFQTLAETVLVQRPLVVLFDNFEDNLRDDALPPEKADLAELLSLWLASPERSRLLFTCRYPFTLSGKPPRRLGSVHLGPLSWAETRKLVARLDGLKTLPAADLLRVWQGVGGHPRALEFADALLRGGTARFDDVAERLFAHLARQPGLTDPAAWCADRAGNLDAALAATVTLAAADVLLDQLLERLSDLPLARRLLLGAAVYREPVDETGLIWQVATPTPHPPDPARTARLEAAEARLKAARQDNPAANLNDVLSPAEMAQATRDWDDEHRPPVTAPAGFAAARRRLLDLSLLAPVRYSDDQPERFLVHRWTAAALTGHASDAERTAAHRAAAGFWRWRAESVRQSREQEIADWLEIRHHLHELGDLAGLHEVSGHIILRLETWGAWEWEERLLHETLAWMPPESAEAAACLFHLGNVAFSRGDHDAALDGYRKALAIDEQLGNREGMAAVYHQLGMIAEVRGALDDAFDWYRKSLAIDEQLGDRKGIAAAYHRLGGIAEERGEFDDALDWYRKSLAINEQLGNRVRIAAAYHQLGSVAQKRGAPDAALDWYRKSLAIDEQLGNRAGIALSLGQIGELLTETGRVAEAVPLTVRSLTLHLGLQSPNARIDLHWLSRQRRALGGDAFGAVVGRLCDAEDTAKLLALIDRLEAAQPDAGTAPSA